MYKLYNYPPGKALHRGAELAWPIFSVLPPPPHPRLSLTTLPSGRDAGDLNPEGFRKMPPSDARRASLPLGGQDGRPPIATTPPRVSGFPPGTVVLGIASWLSLLVHDSQS